MSKLHGNTGVNDTKETC